MCESCKKYCKKPVVIEAVQYHGHNFDEIEKFCTNVGASESCAELRQVRDDVYACFITTLEGEHCASDGDFVIKGIQGEFYPCKPDIFFKTYDALDSISDSIFSESAEELAVKIAEVAYDGCYYYEKEAIPIIQSFLDAQLEECIEAFWQWFTGKSVHENYPATIELVRKVIKERGTP